MYQRYVELLNKHGITTAQVCKDTGISESTMSNWKNRGGCLSAENLKRLAEYFNVPMEYFMTETVNETAQ